MPGTRYSAGLRRAAARSRVDQDCRVVAVAQRTGQIEAARSGVQQRDVRIAYPPCLALARQQRLHDGNPEAVVAKQLVSDAGHQHAGHGASSSSSSSKKKRWPG